jgi:hypothetical protein
VVLKFLWYLPKTFSCECGSKSKMRGDTTQFGFGVRGRLVGVGRRKEVQK